MINDVDEVFHKPFIEQYPEIAQNYLKRIDTPMDFHTIIHKRMKAYRLVSELQDDLILIFTNCLTFVEDGSYYEKYAMYVTRINFTLIFFMIQTLKLMTSIQFAIVIK